MTNFTGIEKMQVKSSCARLRCVKFEAFKVLFSWAPIWSFSITPWNFLATYYINFIALEKCKKECNMLEIIVVQGFVLWKWKLLNFLMDSVLISNLLPALVYLRQRVLLSRMYIYLNLIFIDNKFSCSSWRQYLDSFLGNKWQGRHRKYCNWCSWWHGQVLEMVSVRRKTYPTGLPFPFFT